MSGALFIVNRLPCYTCAVQVYPLPNVALCWKGGVAKSKRSSNIAIMTSASLCPKRFLGSTGLKVSTICLGTMTFGVTEVPKIALAKCRDSL